MHQDKIIRWADSIIQHGPLSNRVYLMHAGTNDVSRLVKRLYELAAGHGYTKIFAKVPESLAGPFSEAGYTTEALVPGMHRGEQDIGFMALYLDPDRRDSADHVRIESVLQTAEARIKMSDDRLLPGDYRVVRLDDSHAKEMAGVFCRVFDTYPFPVFDPGYLRQTMQQGRAAYFGVEHRGRLAALAGAETDMNSLSSEMTDFAVLPDYRGQSLGDVLLKKATRMVKDMGVLTLYTIARACSFGINIIFARAGYKFAGTLLNNTHIAGRIESMNVWYRTL